MANDSKKFTRLNKRAKKLEGKSSELQSEAGRAADLGKAGKAKRKTKRMARVDKRVTNKKKKAGGALMSMMKGAFDKAKVADAYSNNESPRTMEAAPAKRYKKIH